MALLSTPQLPQINPLGTAPLAKVSESIPTALQPEVDAINWFNAQSADEFEVTGIVDAEDSLAQSDEKELRLVLCGGDICQQKKFKVLRSGDSFSVSFTDEEPIANGTQAELDLLRGEKSLA